MFTVDPTLIAYFKLYMRHRYFNMAFVKMVAKHIYEHVDVKAWFMAKVWRVVWFIPNLIHKYILKNVFRVFKLVFLILKGANTFIWLRQRRFFEFIPKFFRFCITAPFRVLTYFVLFNILISASYMYIYGIHFDHLTDAMLEHPQQTISAWLKLYHHICLNLFRFFYRNVYYFKIGVNTLVYYMNIFYVYLIKHWPDYVVYATDCCIQIKHFCVVYIKTPLVQYFINPIYYFYVHKNTKLTAHYMYYLIGLFCWPFKLCVVWVLNYIQFVWAAGLWPTLKLFWHFIVLFFFFLKGTVVFMYHLIPGSWALFGYFMGLFDRILWGTVYITCQIITFAWFKSVALALYFIKLFSLPVYWLSNGFFTHTTHVVYLWPKVYALLSKADFNGAIQMYIDCRKNIHAVKPSVVSQALSYIKHNLIIIKYDYHSQWYKNIRWWRRISRPRPFTYVFKILDHAVRSLIYVIGTEIRSYQRTYINYILSSILFLFLLLLSFTASKYFTTLKFFELLILALFSFSILPLFYLFIAKRFLIFTCLYLLVFLTGLIPYLWYKDYKHKTFYNDVLYIWCQYGIILGWWYMPHNVFWGIAAMLIFKFLRGCVGSGIDHMFERTFEEERIKALEKKKKYEEEEKKKDKELSTSPFIWVRIDHALKKRQESLEVTPPINYDRGSGFIRLKLW